MKKLTQTNRIHQLNILQIGNRFWYDPTEGGLFEVEESVEYQGKRAFRVEDDEEDDFFDRTKKLQNKAKPAKQVETAESLEAKKAVLIQKKDEVLQQMANFEKQELLSTQHFLKSSDVCSRKRICLSCN